MKKSLGLFSKSPDVTHAAKSGTPAMERTQPTIPASVPVPAAAGAGVTDVSVSTVNDSSTLDSKPDARANPPKPSEGNSPNGQPAASSTPAAQSAQAADDTPKNKAYQPVKQKQKKKKNKKSENK